jgi:hypothetical protein
MIKRASRRKAGRPPGGVGGLRVRDYPQVSIRVPPKVHAQLAALTRSTGLSHLEIFSRAIECLQGTLRSERKRMRGRRAA